MDNLIMHATSFTPAVKLNGQSGVLEITGRSTSENALEFYRPLLQWMREYVKQPQPETVLNLQLDYFNSSSSKCLLDIIRSVARIQSEKNNITINWLYFTEDIDMKETGEDLSSLTKVKFRLVEIESK